MRAEDAAERGQGRVVDRGGGGGGEEGRIGRELEAG